MSGARQHSEAPPTVSQPAAPKAEPVAPVSSGLSPESVLRLQASAGNQAVARHFLARQPAPAPTAPAPAPGPGGAPPAAPDVPGRSKLLDAPDPVKDVADDGVHPAGDLAADQSNVTVTLVLRNFNLPPSGDASTIDFLHEPGVSIQVTPGTSSSVAQAAIAAINVHLRRHGKDLVELSASPQGALDTGKGPSVGLQGQAELHVSASFSVTLASSLKAAPHNDTPDPSSPDVPLQSPDKRYDLTWSPLSVGMLFHLDAHEKPGDPGAPLDYAALKTDATLINWVVNQLNPADFMPRNAQEPLQIRDLVTQLLDAMRGGGQPQCTFDFGVLQPEDYPAGLTVSLTRAAQLIAAGNLDAAGATAVRVSVLGLPRDGNGSAHVVRTMLLPVEGQRVTPAAP